MKIKEYLTEALKKKLYYAHPISHYKTALEKDAMKIIRMNGFMPVNPDKPWLAKDYLNLKKIAITKEPEDEHKAVGFGFQAFFNIIDHCDGTALGPYSDGKVSYGAWREVEYTDKQQKPIYLINYKTRKLEPITLQKVKKMLLSPEETRKRSYTEFFI